MPLRLSFSMIRLYWKKGKKRTSRTLLNPLSPEIHHSKMRCLGMVVAHLICMGTCPVTQVSFQQSRELSGVVSKSFQVHLLYGLTTQNTIFGLLRPCSHSSISSICRDNLVLKSCLAVTLPHQVMMSRLKTGLFVVCGARTKCAQRLRAPFLTAHEKFSSSSCALFFPPIFLFFRACFSPYVNAGLYVQSLKSINLVLAFICAKNQLKRLG